MRMKKRTKADLRETMTEEEKFKTSCFICIASGRSEDIDNGQEKLCLLCKRPYCPSHVSTLNNDLCTECVNSSNTSVKSEPLIDENGVTKQNARRIILSGEAWMRQKKLICNMTDIELESFISAHQEAVHEMEIRTDYFRIGLTEATHERAERYNRKIRARSKRAKLLGAVDEVHKASGPSIKNKTEDISKALGALSKLGLSKEQIAAILLNISKNKPKV